MNRVEVTMISWIDQKPLPNVSFWFVAGAALNWPNRVVMGLVGTCNPEPAQTLDNLNAFRARKQYRALASFSLPIQQSSPAEDTIIDGGYTPPFDKSKIDTVLRSVAPIPDDPNFYPGETSPLSAVVTASLHPSSTLTLPTGPSVIASCLIKFRAGKHTDNIGIEEANSPVHVPWVWCECAIILSGPTYRLLGKGSTFPSHAWYVNGTQVAKELQAPVNVSEKEPAISTGRPANQPRVEASRDISKGRITSHNYTLGDGPQKNVDISRFFN